MPIQLNGRWKEFVPAGASPAVDKALKVKGRLGLQGSSSRCRELRDLYVIVRRLPGYSLRCLASSEKAEAQGPAAQPRLRHRPVCGRRHQLRLLHRAPEFRVGLQHVTQCHTGPSGLKETSEYRKILEDLKTRSKPLERNWKISEERAKRTADG